MEPQLLTTFIMLWTSGAVKHEHAHLTLSTNIGIYALNQQSNLHTKVSFQNSNSSVFYDDMVYYSSDDEIVEYDVSSSKQGIRTVRSNGEFKNLRYVLETNSLFYTTPTGIEYIKPLCRDVDTFTPYLYLTRADIIQMQVDNHNRLIFYTYSTGQHSTYRTRLIACKLLHGNDTTSDMVSRSCSRVHTLPNAQPTTFTVDSDNNLLYVYDALESVLLRILYDSLTGETIEYIHITVTDRPILQMYALSGTFTNVLVIFADSNISFVHVFKPEIQWEPFCTVNDITVTSYDKVHDCVRAKRFYIYLISAVVIGVAICATISAIVLYTLKNSFNKGSRYVQTDNEAFITSSQ